jgi:hypothetical protein
MLSLTDAAKQVGRSKSALLKAIKSGKLSAVRGSNGAYSVDLAELLRAYGDLSPSAEPVKTSSEVRTLSPENSAHLERRIFELESERDFLRDRLASRDRDVERLTLLLAPPENSAHPSRGGAWTLVLVVLIILLTGAWIFLASGARTS